VPLAAFFAIAFAHVVAGCGGQDSAQSVGRDCDIELPPPRPDLAPEFDVPPGGRIVVRRLAAGALLCTLLRPDGSRFAEAFRDRHRQILSLTFFRRNGSPLTAVHAAYPAVAGDFGADVKCASPAFASMTRLYWRKPLVWSMGAVPRKPGAAAVVNAVRAAFHEWTSNRNHCRRPDRSAFVSSYQGRTGRHFGDDDYNTVDWGPVSRIPGCRGSIGCTQTWYLPGGGAVESDTRFNINVRWIVGRSTRGYDIQSMAAHEIGHALQFDHVTSVAKRQWTNIMWPYLQEGDRSGRRLGRGDSLADNTRY
jgi:hypothetical protein